MAAGGEVETEAEVLQAVGVRGTTVQGVGEFGQ